MKTLTVDRNMSEMRLDRYVSKVTTLSRGDIQKNIRKKNIKLNGKKASPSDRIKEGDRVSFYIPHGMIISGSETGSAVIRTEFPLPVLYENEEVLIVDKPAGMLSQSDGSKKKDIVSAARRSGYPDAGVVTRLDMNTSGAVLLGKNRRSLMLLNEMSKSGRLTKKYTALVKGRFDGEGEVTLYGRKDSEKNRLLVADEEKEGFSRIVCIFRVLERYAGYTLVQAELVTGKTHQIRAMLSHLGFPVAGDAKYGGSVPGLDRQFLHCSFLGLETSGRYAELSRESITVSSGLPEELSEFVGGLK